MFSGVLDKGADEVFLGGTRLKRFMDSVDKATGTIPEPMPRQAKAGGNGDRAEEEVSTKAKDIESTGSQEVWNDVISAGVTFLDKIGQTLLAGEGRSGKPGTRGVAGLEIETDKATGQQHLRLPMPKKETIQSLVNLLSDFSKKL